MNDLFIALCGGVASAMEMLKPAIKEALKVQDTSGPWYVVSMWALAMVLGTVGAFALNVNIFASFHVSPVVGIIATGVVSAGGSEIGHRILEAVKALSGTIQRQASKPL